MSFDHIFEDSLKFQPEMTCLFFRTSNVNDENVIQSFKINVDKGETVRLEQPIYNVRNRYSDSSTPLFTIRPKSYRIKMNQESPELYSRYGKL